MNQWMKECQCVLEIVEMLSNVYIEQPNLFFTVRQERECLNTNKIDKSFHTESVISFMLGVFFYTEA